MADKQKQNTYYHVVFQRRNVLKDIIYDFFLSVASIPRLVLEVFIRRNMGERYFSLFVAGLIIVGLVVFPFFLEGRYTSFKSAIGDHKLWYLFTAAFVMCSFLRWREVTTLPSVFELKRFSLSPGYSFSFFYQISGNPLVRVTLLEPGAVSILGVCLLLLKQEPLGWLLIVCSVIYSVSYLAAHYRANDFIMDKMDELICKKELHDSFVEDKDPRQTKGFEFVGSRPKGRDMRERVEKTFFEEDDAPEVR